MPDPSNTATNPTSDAATAAGEATPAPGLPSDANNIVVYVFPDPNNPDPQSTVGGLYSIPPQVYSDPQYRITGTVAATPAELLSQGVVVAKIPNPAVGSGGFCYLLSLPALTPPPVNPSLFPDKDKGT